jgi:PBP1b-binding outer membrane lipoprotein LpoB
MKTLKLTISILFITILFTACSSKVETHVVESNKDDVSKLLKTLIQKEKEINKLNQNLEDCKKTDTTK